MTGLYLNRARRDLLAAIGRGRVTLNEAGHPFLRVFRGYNHRCDKDVRLLLDAGLIVVDEARGRYELTPAGEALLGGGVVTEPLPQPPLPDLAGVSLAELRDLDLAEEQERIEEQVQRPRFNLGGSSPPGRAD